MSWIDKKSVEQILKLRDTFSISTFLETGTFMGINARFHSYNFKEVLSCDINEEYLKIAKEKTKSLSNVFLYRKSSPRFLTDFIEDYKEKERKDIVFIYLDAHFYDSSLPKKDKWVVKNELKALRDFNNCVICIHDFDNGLGHIVYDGEHLGLPLIKKDLMKVNPGFSLYTNDLVSCDTITNPAEIKGLYADFETLDGIQFAHSTPRLTYRGILYCTPKKLDIKKFDLRKIEFKRA